MRDRLFAIDVLACFARGDERQRVPMVRRADDDGVDVYLREQLTEILEPPGRPTACAGNFGGGAVQVSLAHVANCEDINSVKTHELMQIVSSHCAAPDQAKPHPVIRARALRKDAGVQRETEAHSAGYGAGLFEELASGLQRVLRQRSWK